MKKLFSSLLLIVFVLGLSACTNTNDNNGDDNGNSTETVSISFASWGDPEFEQKMIDKFEEKYPHIEVYLDDTIGGSGGEFTLNLVAAAQAGTVPDVFAIDNVPTAIDKGLVYNIAELWNNDPDAAKVYDNIAETGSFNNGSIRYSAPSYQFIKGVYINKTLLDDAGLDLPEKDWTYDEMIQLARDFTDPNDYMYGIQGPWGNLDFDAVFPSLDDETVGYHTWDGEKFNFTSQAWIDAYNLRMELRQEGVEEQMTAEEKEAVFGAQDAWPFYEGHTLMSIDGSWNLGWMIPDFESRGFDLAFYPYPGGDAGQRIPVILDYMCVSALTEYPEEAFLLLKWMSFGEEGWQARLEIMEEMELPITAFPVADYPDIWATLEEMASSVDGMSENIALIHNGVPDTDKWLPGYNDFWAWYASDENPYLEQWDSMTPEQFAPIWQAKMNELINEAYEKYDLEK